MSKRREFGGTLAFIVIATFVIILVGIGFFVLARIMGGGQEAQHATDSGNLNVAKQALLAPNIPPTSLQNVPGKPNLAAEFNGCYDPRNGSVDLQYYNKFVGKALLVALNASAENTDLAKSNAREEIALVQGPGGIGEQLATQLATASKLENFFQDLSHSNNVRMLSTDQVQKVRNDGSNYKVSYMLQNAQAPSNLYIKKSDEGGLLPPGTNAFLTDGNNAADRGDRRYLVGYHKINVPGVGDLQFVPVRPKEQPHLVGQQQFAEGITSPLPGGAAGSLIPPNAFGSQSLSKEQQTKVDVSSRSSAIVGVVDVTEGTPTTPGGQFPPQIPGFLIIDNSKALIDGVNFTKAITLDKNALALMAGVNAQLDGSGQPHFDPTGGAKFDTIKAASGTVPIALGQDIVPKITNQGDLNGLRDNLKNGGTFPCNNINSVAGKSYTNPSCVELAKDVAGGSKPITTTETVNGLMPVEALKVAIISIRDSGAGCAVTSIAVGQNKLCGGLKSWNNSAQTNAIPFGTTGNLNTLFQTTNGSALLTQVVQRMSEMRGKSVSTGDPNVAEALNTPIPAGKTFFMYYNGPTDKFVFVDKLTSLPGGFETTTFQADLNSGKIPDGTRVESVRPTTDLDSVIVNVDGDGGYPHPWDCAYVGASARDTGAFTPSSGYDNLLGVVDFSNCVQAPDGEYCCPC